MNLISEKQNSFKGDIADLGWKLENELCDKMNSYFYKVTT